MTRIYLGVIYIIGGVLNFFFGYVPSRFPKVGSREQVFLKKLGVLGVNYIVSTMFCVKTGHQVTLGL